MPSHNLIEQVFYRRIRYDIDTYSMQRKVTHNALSFNNITRKVINVSVFFDEVEPFYAVNLIVYHGVYFRFFRRGTKKFMCLLFTKIYPRTG